MKKKTTLIVLAALVLLVALAFEGVRRCDFINYDDPEYVFENPNVQAGLSWEQIKWAFSSHTGGNWHPVTMISLMLDRTLFGPGPLGFHVTSVVIHGLTTLLLFLALRSLTGDLWRSALVSALWSVHPLRVESVAWVSERKDVLCAMFAMGMLWAYSRYARRPSVWRYVQVCVLFALSLMSKPMAVTMPCVLILLDFWPLGRLTLTRPVNLRPIWEKLPLLLMAFAIGALTYLVQAGAGAVPHISKFGLSSRLSNSIVSYAGYIGKTIYPEGLSVFYPMKAGGWPFWQVSSALALLAAISCAAAWQWRRGPWIAVGWLWYLGMLVPVIGLVQAGSQSMADRYTYLPGIGLLIAVLWSLPHPRGGLRYVYAAAAAILLSLGVAGTRAQLEFWRTSGTLFRHALEVTSENFTAHQNMAEYLLATGDLKGAENHALKAMSLVSGSAPLYSLMAMLRLKQGNLESAQESALAAAKLAPSDTEVKAALAIIRLRLLARQNNLHEAADTMKSFLAESPSSAIAWNELGCLQRQNGEIDAADSSFKRAADIDPGSVEARVNLGINHILSGREAAAVAPLLEAISLRNDSFDAHNNLVAALLTLRRHGDALPYAVRAAELRPDSADACYNLGLTYAGLGRWNEAAAACARALELQPDDQGIRTLYKKTGAMLSK